jgi:hypothetical protein
VPNGKPGDFAATDIKHYGYRVFTPEMDALVEEIDGFTEDYAAFDPFGNELVSFMMAARLDRGLWPELRRRLEERRDELRDAKPRAT